MLYRRISYARMSYAKMPYARMPYARVPYGMAQYPGANNWHQCLDIEKEDGGIYQLACLPDLW